MAAMKPMNSAAVSPSNAAARVSAKIAGSLSTIKWAARAAAAVIAVWLGCSSFFMQRTLIADFLTIPQNRNF
jgi:hypothetical protein